MYSELPDSERASAHEQAARLLSSEGAPPEQVAAHLLVSDPDANEDAVAILREAARRALARGAPDVASAYLRRAIAEPPLSAEQADCLRELGVAELRAGDAGAVAHLERALEVTEDPHSRARLTVLLARALWISGRPQDAVAVLERAIEPAAQVDSDLALRLEAEFGTMALQDLSIVPQARERLLRFRGQLEGRSRAERVLLAAVAALSMSLGETADEVVDVAKRALGGLRLLREQSSEWPLYQVVVMLLLRADQLELANRQLDAALADARTRGSPLAFCGISVLRSQLAYRRGVLADAEAEARGALDAAQLHQSFLDLYALAALSSR